LRKDIIDLPKTESQLISSNFLSIIILFYAK
jgi:hypothetical protein